MKNWEKLEGCSEIRDKKKIIFVYHDLEGCTRFMSFYQNGNNVDLN